MFRKFQYFLFFLTLPYLNFQNGYSQDLWKIDHYKNHSYAIVSGEIINNDKFVFALSAEDECLEVSTMFSFFTLDPPGNFDQIIGRKIPILLNTIETTAEVLSIFPYKGGLKVVFYMGTFPIKEYIDAVNKLYNAEKTYKVRIVDGLNFQASEYFEIIENNWNLDEFIPSIDKAYDVCSKMRKNNV